MRNLVYILDNGTKVKTFEEAHKPGHSYKVEYEKVTHEPLKMSPKAKAMQRQIKIHS